MATVESLAPYGATISFETYAPAILGTSFKNCLVLSHLNGATVRKLGVDVEARHRAVYRSLPAGSIDNALGYQYLELQLPNGNIEYVGTAWIKPETITSAKKGKITVVFEDVGQQDINEIRLMCIANNYTNINISYE